MLLYTPLFEKLRAPELIQPVQVTDGKRKVIFWVSLLAAFAFGAVVFLPIMAKSNTLYADEQDVL